MKCTVCNQELQDNAQFCSQCGIRVYEDKKTISLQCKMCGGEMSLNSDDTILICPYCGSKELIVESDAIKIEKIKHSVNKEIELEKMKLFEKQQRDLQESELKKEKKEFAERFKESKLGKFLIIAFLLTIVLAYLYFSEKLIWAGLLTAIQTGCFGVAWLMGMKIIKEKTNYLHIIFTIIGILLIIPVLKYIVYL